MPLITGAIVMWSGLIADIPAGWALCDGQNGTLDLRNRFVVGAGNLYAVGATGGSADATLVSHTHSGSTNSVDSHNHRLNSDEFPMSSGEHLASNVNGNAGGLFTNTHNHSHTLTIGTTGSSATNANLPPYYALAFIQQL